MAVVPQDVTLLDTSIRANIAFDEEVDDVRLERAVAQAQLADLIADLPEGIDSEAGEAGPRLSGGQRQRIGIARALYRDPSLLVMDEATSALDNATERRLTETIDGLKGRVTVVIVAHRLSTVRHCDQSVFMSDGRVANVGTFDEVRDANTEFAHLVKLGSLSSLDQPESLPDRPSRPADPPPRTIVRRAATNVRRSGCGRRSAEPRLARGCLRAARFRHGPPSRRTSSW